MRRTERLFQIIQMLRRARRPVTAQTMAAELKTSLRTLYRDISDLVSQGVPVRGEAGVGYVLDQGFDMPPMMLTADEVEAAVLGVKWVARQGDPVLTRAAEDLLSKIAAVIPDHLRPLVLETALAVPDFSQRPKDALDMAQLRAAIYRQGRVALRYRDEQGVESERIIWPLAIAYFDAVRVIPAWCELRQGFRAFRTDRVLEALFLETRYPGRRMQVLAQWKAEMMERERRGETICPEQAAREAAREAAPKSPEAPQPAVPARRESAAARIN
ncbi:MAG: helix-turn-helix transcriptional regulator [Asticcacaulis sp.]